MGNADFSQQIGLVFAWDSKVPLFSEMKKLSDLPNDAKVQSFLQWDLVPVGTQQEHVVESLTKKKEQLYKELLDVFSREFLSL